MTACAARSAIILLVVAALGHAAPVALVLEDFEGPLKGWSGGGAVQADAAQGAGALAWPAPEGTGPKSMNFAFGGRGVEMDDWDRLIFDYKIDGPGCVWWGVKIVDWPLADGMQATWQLADKDSLRAGQWHTAVLELHQPKWHWGDKPDRNSQVIYFRYECDGKARPRFLLDNLRLERDPIRITGVAEGTTVTTAETLSVTHTITVANSSAAAVDLVARLPDVTAGATVRAEPARGRVEAGQQWETRVTLEAPRTGASAPAPLSVVNATVAVSIDGQADTEQRRAMSLRVPLGEVQHPCLLVTREQAQRVLAKTGADANMKAIYDALVKRADGWLSRQPQYPDRGSQWWHWYTCKKCGGALQTKSPTEHVCADCGAAYTGWPYDDVVLDRQHGELARAIQELGLVYVFTGDARYAAKAREILLGYAERYLNYPLHDINGKPNRGGGHVGPQTLDESTWLIPVAQGFDCIYDTLSEDDLAVISEKLLLPAATLIHDHQWGIHNICCWHASAYGLVGITLGDETLAADAISGPKGFRAQVAQGVDDDGFWYEGAWGYHYYTMMALQPLAIAARNISIDVYTDRYKGMYDAPLAFMAPGGALPAFNDSGTANALGGGNRYEVSYDRWRDPRHLLPIVNAPRNSLETLLFGADLTAAADFQLGSALFPAAGFAVLRSGAVTGRVPGNYLALDFGPHGGGHGHPDKLGFVLYGKGQLISEDPGCIAYGNPAHGGWYRQTISHNTVVVNGESQKPCTGKLQFFAADTDISIAGARADEAYSRADLRRTVALVGDRVIDIYLCSAEEPVTFDWVHHARGALSTPLDLQPLEQAPPGAGYDWAKQWRSAKAGGPWSATWLQESGVGLHLVQAPPEGDHEVLSAVGMGNPTKIKVPFVVSRVNGEVAEYCTAMQVFRGAQAPELAVRSIAVEGPTAGGLDLPSAVEVTGDGMRDVVLVNPGGGKITAGDYELDGQAAVLHYVGETLEQVLVVGGGAVRVRGQAVP